MNTILSRLLLIAVLPMAFYAFTQDDFKPFEIALKTGNAKALSTYFDEQVELSIQGADYNIQNNYSRAQAKNILINFFKDNKATSYSTKHTGASDWSKYIIGYLTTDKGKYRTLLRYIKSEEGLRIQELELTLEND